MIEGAVHQWAEETGRTVETVDVGVDYEDGLAQVNLVVATPNDGPPVGELANAIAEEIDQPVTVDIQVMETDRSLVSVSDPNPEDVTNSDVSVEE